MLVERTVCDAFLERCAAATAALVVGDPHVAATDVGPMISFDAAMVAADKVADAVEHGATI